MNGINDEMMTTEITKELTTMKATTEITSKQVLSWEKRVGAQGAQKVMLSGIQENKGFDMIRYTKPHKTFSNLQTDS